MTAPAQRTCADCHWYVVMCCSERSRKPHQPTDAACTGFDTDGDVRLRVLRAEMADTERGKQLPLRLRGAL